MLNNPKAGTSYAAEFQSSALPFTTSSQASSGVTYRIDFPKVSRFITVRNQSTSAADGLRIGFTRNGIQSGNYYLVPGASSDITFEIRVKEMYVRSDSAASPNYSILAGLTNIDAVMMPVLTGTLGNGDPGWMGVG